MVVASAPAGGGCAHTAGCACHTVDGLLLQCCWDAGMHRSLVPWQPEHDQRGEAKPRTPPECLGHAAGMREVPSEGLRHRTYA